VRYDENRTNRDIILKARKEGFSSLILAEYLMDCLQTPNTASVVVSHEEKATQRLLARVRMYIERFYDGENFVKIPLKYNSKSELYFPETNSTFYIGTAGGKSFGRADVINNLHISEIAFFEKPEEFITGIIPAVPDTGRIVVETTANGFNYLKNYWERSRRGETSFKTHFFPWWMASEYTLKGSKIDTLTDEETSLIERFNLTEDQIRWRRWKIGEFPSEQMFKQEYPADEFEAFITSGRPVFNSEILKLYLANLN
ncbi:MAG: hypothetical protein ABIJ08_07280, partial [Nanoarchaeota archaeon]